MKKKLVWISGAAVALVLIAVAGFVGQRIYILQAMNPEGNYFDSDGVRIHYTVHGTGVPVVLVHGLAVNAGINFGARGVISKLAKSYQVITFDNRGHGRSDKPHDTKAYGLELCNDIVRLLDHLHIEKAHIVGYSMGGFITLKFATLYPDRILSFAPCGAGWTPNADEQLKFFFELARDLEEGRGYGLLSDRLTPIGRKVSFMDRFLMTVTLAAINDNKAIAAFLRSVPELHVTEEALRANQLPALTIVGERDPLRFLAEKMASVTPHMQLVITPDADHMSTLRRPTTLDALKAFLKENTTMNNQNQKEAA